MEISLADIAAMEPLVGKISAVAFPDRHDVAAFQVKDAIHLVWPMTSGIRSMEHCSSDGVYGEDGKQYRLLKVVHGEDDFVKGDYVFVHFAVYDREGRFERIRASFMGTGREPSNPRNELNAFWNAQAHSYRTGA